MTAQGHRIFVSHSHLDNDFGTRFAQDLRRALGDESAVWYDVLGGLHGGETWWEKIVAELTARDVFIVALSPDAMNSSWVRREITMAFNESKFILPVLHRSCSIRADLKILQIISFLAPKSYEQAFGEVLLALGLPTSAPIEPVKQASSSSDPAAALLDQLQAAFAAHDWPDVIRKADYLIKRMPGGALALVYRMQGVALLEEGEEQQAQEAFETALALVSDRELRLTLLSDSIALLAKQGQWTKVQQRAKEALRLVPNDPGWLAIQQQAQSELAKQAAAGAPSRTQTHAKKPPPSLPPQKTKAQWLEEGYALIELKRYEEALATYEQAIRLDPNYALAYNSKGSTLVELKRYEEALAACEQAIRLDPNLARAYNTKGITLHYLKRYEEALAADEQAIRLDPNLARAYNSKGAALHYLKRYEEALAACEQAIRLDPNLARAHNTKGYALNELKRYEEALAADNQAIRLDPNFAIAYNNKGIALYNLKRYEEALAADNQAIRLDPNDPWAYYNKGLVLERLGKKTEAQQAYARARQLGFHIIGYHS